MEIATMKKHVPAVTITENKSTLNMYSSSNDLNLIILPTEQCNFRCVYCYEDFSNAKRMDKSVVNGIKNLITARSEIGIDHLNLSWFGGEPLAAYHTVLDIMEHAKEVSKNKSMNLTSDMTTNGYLLSFDKLESLVDYNVNSYQITFDGDKNYHDKFRIRADKKGTFDTIWGNIITAHKSKEINFDITLRLHVNKENVDNIKQFLRRVHDDLEADNRFNVFIRSLSRLGGSNDKNLPILNDNGAMQENEIISLLRKEAAELHLKQVPIADNYVCYAAKLNTLLIRSDGRLGKCTVALYDSKNTIGRLQEDGTVVIDKEKAAWWSRGLFTEDRSQLSCPLISK